MRLLPLAAAAALSAAAFGSACPALAQSANNGSNDHVTPAQTTGVQTNADENGNENGRDSEQGGWRHGHPGWRGGEHGRWMMGGRRGMMMQRGAEFRFKRGNARIDVRCPAQQSLNDCVEAAGKLIREIAAMKPGPKAPPPPPGRPGAGTNGLGNNGPGPNGNNAGGMPGMPGGASRPGAEQ